KGDLLAIAGSIRPGTLLVEDIAQCVHHLQVGFLVAAADVVGFAWYSGIENTTDRGAVVFDEKPVAYLLAVAIDGQFLARKRVMDDQRNQLFGEVIGAV